MRKEFLFMTVCVCAVMSGVLQADAQWFLFKNPLLGKQAKEFSLQDASGKQQSLSGLRAGQPAILFFWATWCRHCVNQFSDLKQNEQVFSRKNIKLILINLGEDAQKIRNFMSRRGVSFDVLIDGNGGVAGDYGVKGIPTYIFISKDGIVKAVEHSVPEDYERLLKE